MPTGMSEKQEQLFLLFKDAIESDRKAQAMYKTAKEHVHDDDLKEILENLYQDEVRHERKLMDKYNIMTKKYKIPKD